MDRKLFFITINVFAIFFSNIVPLIGPSLASGALGFNEKRFNKNYEISRQSSLLAIVLGHTLFFLLAGFIVNFVVNFSSQKIFWLFTTLPFFVTILLSMIFYFVGAKRYQK